MNQTCFKLVYKLDMKIAPMCFQANVLTKTTCLEKLWHEYVGMDITLYILEVAVVEVPVKPETS